ncbi:suppressor of kinetochore protein mutant [Balamuthia mandrillaris]
MDILYTITTIITTTKLTNTKIKLQSKDGVVFEVDPEAVKVSSTIRHMLEDVEEQELGGGHKEEGEEAPPIILPVEPAPTKKPRTNADNKPPPIDERFKLWSDLDQQALFRLILAANFLDIKPLLDLTCDAVAKMIQGKTPEEIRQTFNIENDFTPKEEEQKKKEIEWCLDL